MDYPETKTICIPCGVNITNGEKLSTTVTILPADENTEEDARERRRPVKILSSLWTFVTMLIPGILWPPILIVCILLIPLAAFVVHLGMVMFFLGLPFAGIMVCGLSVAIYWQAVAWMQTGQWMLLQNALVEYNTMQWFFFMIATLIPYGGFLAYMVYVVHPQMPK